MKSENERYYVYLLEPLDGECLFGSFGDEESLMSYLHQFIVNGKFASNKIAIVKGIELHPTVKFTLE